MIRFIIALLLALLLSATADAATLTFNDNSTNETGWVVYIIHADGSAASFLTFPSTTITTLGPVSINVTQVVAGDCVTVAAYNNAGVSNWTPRGCAVPPGGTLATTPSNPQFK